MVRHIQWAGHERIQAECTPSRVQENGARFLPGLSSKKSILRRGSFSGPPVCANPPGVLALPGGPEIKIRARIWPRSGKVVQMNPIRARIDLGVNTWKREVREDIQHWIRGRGNGDFSGFLDLILFGCRSFFEFFFRNFCNVIGFF